MYEDIYCHVCGGLVCQSCGCCCNSSCENCSCPETTKEEPEISVGDTVFIFWLATNKMEPVNYRGKTGNKAMIVKNQQQMFVPFSDLKLQKESKWKLK